MSASPILTTEPVSRPSQRRWKKLREAFLRPSVLIRVVLYLMVLIYLRSIFFDYVYDDSELIILNPWMQSWHYVPTIFTHSFWGFMEAPRGIDFYRPLVMLLLLSIRRILGTSPGWFHLVAAGLHILATYLTYRLACETTGNKTLSAIAAGIFGLHPTKVETAAWISGISDSLSVVFFLGSMIAYFRWSKERAKGLGRKHLLASLALLLLALFSKEAAIFAPLLIGIYEYSIAKGTMKERVRTMIAAAWPFVATLAIALTIRLSIVRTPKGGLLNEIHFLATLLTAPEVILWYLGKQLWPVGLSVQYPMMIVKNVSLLHFILPACILLLATAAVILSVRKSPIGIFFASWFVVMLAPIVIYHVALQEHDRYDYLASVATSIALGWIITMLTRAGSTPRTVTILLLFAALSTLTWNYESYWDNDVALFTRAVKLAPDNRNGSSYLVQVYISEGKWDEAKALAQWLIAQPHSQYAGWCAMGDIRASQGNYEEGRTAMLQALRFPHGKGIGCELALADFDLILGRDEEAAQLYKADLQQYPNIAFLHGRLATALKAMGRIQEAQEQLSVENHLR